MSIANTSLPGSDVEGTETWPYAGTAGAITAMGAKHVVTDVSQAHVDTNNKVCAIRNSNFRRLKICRKSLKKLFTTI